MTLLEELENAAVLLSTFDYDEVAARLRVHAERLAEHLDRAVLHAGNPNASERLTWSHIRSTLERINGGPK